MVGGFVQQQQVRGAHQRTRQLQAHAPATRKTVDRVGEFGGFKTQTKDQGLGPRWCVVRTRILQCHVGMGHAVVVVSGLRSGDFQLGCQQGCVTINHKVSGALVGFGHVLGDLPHAPLCGDVVLASVFVQVAIKKCKQA